MNILFYLPTHIFNFIISNIIPSFIFKKVYVQSSENIRKQEEDVRNAFRIATYHAKKSLKKS